MDPSPSNRLWRKPSDTDMSPYRDPILDRWEAGYTAAEIQAEIPVLTKRQIDNFLRYEGMKRDAARDPRIDPVKHHAAKMARREPSPVMHGPLLCPELGLKSTPYRVLSRFAYEGNGGLSATYVTVSLPRLTFLEAVSP